MEKESSWSSLSPDALRCGSLRLQDRQKKATVAAVFAKAPFVRTPQMIIDSLFPAGVKAASKQPAPKPEHKRVWVSLQKSKSDLIEEVRQEVLRRDPGGLMTLVALTDGERAFQKRVVKSMKVTLILDLIHVLERVWTAAHVFQPEGSAEAEVYAKLMASRILEGDVLQVVKGIRQTVTKRALIGRSEKICWPLRPVPRLWLPYRQWPRGGRLQESDQGPHGAFRYALDTGDGRSNRQATLSVPQRRLR